MKQNDTFSLTCEVSGDPLPSKIVWTLPSGEEIESNPLKIGKFVGFTKIYANFGASVKSN